MKLNLGCGYTILDGWVNLDYLDGQGVDVVHDLEKFPYPFKDNTFDKVLASHIIEHLSNPDGLVRELWRISKNGARIKIQTPHYSNGSIGWSDTTHKRLFSCISFYNFIGVRSYTLETSRPEHFIVRKTYIDFGRLHRMMGLQFLFNLSDKMRAIYECFFCYIFPARNMTFILEVKK